MENKRPPAVRLVVLMSVVGGLLFAAGSAGAHPPAENSPALQIEIPEAQIAATDQSNLNVESTDVKLILIHILRPDADNIDYGQIFPKVNGAAASRISETRPGLNGKVLRINLHTRPGFELLPGSNAIEVQAHDHDGRTLSATFYLHTPSGACRGGGRAKILELTSLGDLLHAGVTMDRLVQLVVECGVKFLPSAETDQRLQDLGAEPKLLAAIHNPAAPQFRSYETHAVKLDQVMSLLQSHVPESDIIANVDDNGVSFEVNPEVEEKLRAAGASQELIQSIRYMAGAKVSDADSKALSLSQILHLLEGGAVAKERLFTLVQQRGVSFRLDRATEDRLRQGGANEKLMLAIRDAADQYAATH
jgi:hypothetical protein